MSKANIKVGIGGWTYEPWRDNFYPKGLAHAKELNYASRKVSAIEINGTMSVSHRGPQEMPCRQSTIA